MANTARKIHVVRNDEPRTRGAANANTSGPWAKMGALLLGASLFLFAYLFEGGHISPLVQPAAFLIVAVLPFTFCAHRYGFKAAGSGYLWMFVGRQSRSLNEQSSRELATTAFQATLTATHLCGLVGWLVTFGHLTEGMQSVGEHLATILVAYMYGLFIASLIPASSKEEGRAFAIGLSVLPPAFSALAVLALLFHF